MIPQIERKPVLDTKGRPIPNAYKYYVGKAEIGSINLNRRKRTFTIQCRFMSAWLFRDTIIEAELELNELWEQFKKDIGVE